MKPADQTQPNRIETGLSIAILVVLCAIGLRTFYVQYQYSPAVLLSEQISEPSSQPADIGDDATTTLFALPHGLQPFTPPERFDPQTLSDKINGKAELYLSAGFRELNSQRIKFSETSAGWMEIYIYDMANEKNAFAVFSAQRRDDAVPLDIAPYAYRTQNAMFWVHGPYYLEVIAADSSSEAMSAMQRVGNAFMQQTSVQTEAIGETDLFPKTGLIQESIALIPSDAFGYDQLDRVFVAEYQVGENRLSAFLSKRKSVQEAQKLAQGYSTFLLTYGGTLIPQVKDDPQMRIIQILGAHEVIFSQGVYLAGVHEADDLQQGMELANRLQQRLKEID